jgi:hypothetical protein
MLRPQISGLDELRDHLVGMNPAGKKHQAAGQRRQSYAKRYFTALKLGICPLRVELSQRVDKSVTRGAGAAAIGWLRVALWPNHAARFGAGLMTKPLWKCRA